MGAADYINMYGPGKGPADYAEPEFREGRRSEYIEGNKARIMPWAEYAMPEIGKGRDLIRLMPTKLLWALQSRWFMDPEVGWKVKETHFNKLIKFWAAAIPEQVIARHIKLTMPDAVIETGEKSFAPFPAVHRSYVDDFDLKVTRGGQVRFYEIKHNKANWSNANNCCHGPDKMNLWVAKREQVADKRDQTHAWIWLNRNMTSMRIIEASTFSQWKLDTYLSNPPETWYSAPLELWKFKSIRG